jgi:sugar phosphate isomerase/epimerase
MTRSEILAAAVTVPAWMSVPEIVPETVQAAAAPLRHMGLAPTACALRNLYKTDTFDIVNHAHQLGLGSVQTRFETHDPATVKAFRQRVDAYGLLAILSTPLPIDETDLPEFDKAVAACKEAGAVMLHVPMTHRRYEQFKTFETYNAYFDRCKRTIQLAEPVLRKHRIRLAIENHKGWRAAEHAAWIKSVASEWIGVCLDFGNNLALCEDPMETLRELGPYTIYCHIKDMGVEPYADGFHMSEVVFGEGFLDLPGIVKTLQKQDPRMIFALEMITRDPLKIPVFTDAYWGTFDDAASPLPGRDLARVLTLVKNNPPKTPLPRITGLTPDAQVRLEDDLNLKCVQYCRQHMSLS